MMRYSEWESVGESSEPELKTTIQSDQIWPHMSASTAR
jgi:hypothetical protein